MVIQRRVIFAQEFDGTQRAWQRFVRYGEEFLGINLSSAAARAICGIVV